MWYDKVWYGKVRYKINVMLFIFYLFFTLSYEHLEGKDHVFLTWYQKPWYGTLYIYTIKNYVTWFKVTDQMQLGCAFSMHRNQNIK